MDNRILSVFLVDDEKIIRDGMKKLFTWGNQRFPASSAKPAMGGARWPRSSKKGLILSSPI